MLHTVTVTSCNSYGAKRASVENKETLVTRYFRLLAFVLVGLASAASTSAARADVNVKFPDESAYAPIFARSLHVEDPNSEWIPILFYRDLSCVPDDYDLVVFFDSRARSCALLVEGTQVFDDDTPGPPHQVTMQGRDTPVWFVTRTDWEGAGGTADFTGSVTLNEVKAMPSLLRGVARLYHEVLHPIPGPPGSGAQVVKDLYSGRGALADGRAFSLLVGGMHDPSAERITLASYRLSVWHVRFE